MTSPRDLLRGSYWPTIGLLLVAPLHAVGQAGPDQLTLEPLVELQSADAPVVPSLHQSIVHAGDRGNGSFLVSYLYREPVIAVYDDTGSFERLYDSQGEGPGEFQFYPKLFRGPEGSVLAFENGRLHRFDGELQHRDTRTLARRVFQTMAALPDGRVVVDDMPTTTSGSTPTFSVLDPTGDLDVDGMELADPMVRTLIAPASEGEFWTLRGSGILLERRNADGTVVHGAEVEGGAVEPWTTGRIEGEGRDVPRRARYTGLADLGDGTLLLVAWVAPEDWEPAEESDEDTVLDPGLIDANQEYDTVVEHVDASSGQVLADLRVPHALVTVKGAPRLLHSRHPVGDVGHVLTRIWQVRVPPNGL